MTSPFFRILCFLALSTPLLSQELSVPPKLPSLNYFDAANYILSDEILRDELEVSPSQVAQLRKMFIDPEILKRLDSQTQKEHAKYLSTDRDVRKAALLDRTTVRQRALVAIDADVLESLAAILHDKQIENLIPVILTRRFQRGYSPFFDMEVQTYRRE